MKVVKENQIKKHPMECEAVLAFRCILPEITSLNVCEQSPETDLKRDNIQYVCTMGLAVQEFNHQIRKSTI